MRHLKYEWEKFSLFVIFGFYVQYFCYLIYGIFRDRSGWNFRHPLSGSFI